MVSKPGHSGQALVVDDEHLMRWFLREALQREGFEVREAASGREALLVASAGTMVDLLLVDQRLPDTDGLTLMGQLGAIHPEARRVLMTAVVPADVRERAEREGPTRILEKPFDADDLEAVLHGYGSAGR